VTTLGARRSGDRVNLEMDVLGKYVQALLPAAGAAAEDARAFLDRQGLLARAREG
jgi:riboflavin synthase alpha subunit